MARYYIEHVGGECPLARVVLDLLDEVEELRNDIARLKAAGSALAPEVPR